MKIDSHLEDRSYLTFHFYQGSNTKSGDHIKSTKTLDFMENVRIQEQQASRLTTYSAIGRNGNNYLHMGSDSRKFNLSFNITLPHIMETSPIVMDSTLTPMQRYEKNKQLREQYLNGGSSEVIGDGTSYKDYVRLADNMFRGYLSDQEKFGDILSVLGQGGAAGFLGAPSYESDNRTRAVADCLFWLNLIRSSTLTYAPKPHYGPPLIRLHHGIVYQNVPCIATNYTINIDGQAGYDNRTLLPRVIKVTMNLQEVRISSLTNEFDPVGGTSREFDSDVGWEAIHKFVSYNRITDSSIEVDRTNAT